MLTHRYGCLSGIQVPCEDVCVSVYLCKPVTVTDLERAGSGRTCSLCLRRRKHTYNLIKPYDHPTHTRTPSCSFPPRVAVSSHSPLSYKILNDISSPISPLTHSVGPLFYLGKSFCHIFETRFPFSGCLSISPHLFAASICISVSKFL